jgi:hypothetical protein
LYHPIPRVQQTHMMPYRTVDFLPDGSSFVF